MDKKTKWDPEGDMEKAFVGVSDEGMEEMKDDFQSHNMWNTLAALPESGVQALYEDDTLVREIEHLLVIFMHDNCTVGELENLKWGIFNLMLAAHDEGRARFK